MRGVLFFALRGQRETARLPAKNPAMAGTPPAPPQLRLTAQHFDRDLRRLSRAFAHPHTLGLKRFLLSLRGP
jgi:hypothetical protein